MDNKIFAVFDEQTIRVYQAYNNTIADEAIKIGTFGDSFKLSRMTWIKPSFLWMMYRSGWGEKEGQNRILAIDMKRTGFENKRLEDNLKNSEYNIFFDAPAAIFVFGAPGIVTAVEDASLAVANMMLAAVSMEMGTCWIGLAMCLSEYDR